MTLLLYLCDYAQQSLLSVLLCEAIFSEYETKLYAPISRIVVRYFVQKINHNVYFLPKYLTSIADKPLFRAVTVVMATVKAEGATNKLTVFLARVIAV